MIASMTFSGTPLFLSAISASVWVSNLVGLFRILAMMTRSDSPALTISTTDSFVSTSCAPTERVVRSEAIKNATMKKALIPRLRRKRGPLRRDTGRHRN